MKFIENKTKFTHLRMPSWGIGTFRESDNNYITIEFEKIGLKKFTKNSINTMLKVVGEMDNIKSAPVNHISTQSLSVSVNTNNGSLIQFDGEYDGIAGKNVIEAFASNDSVIFNETYIIIGEHTKALKIHAMYDLTIMGDVTVQDCVVNGSLTIIGSAHIMNLTCYNEFICKGDLYSNKIYVGSNMIVDSVVCDELVCDGNIAIKTTANINKYAKISKTIVACEGIVGAGKFSAMNAIATEYFEFDGEYEGKILELEMDTAISNSVSVKKVSAETIEEIIGLANQKLAEVYSTCPSLNEEEIIKYLRDLKAIENKQLRNLPLVEPLFSRLIDISYQDKIETIDDYLMVLVAQKTLPTEIYSYESVNHVGKLFLPRAQEEMEKLTFEPTTIIEFAKVLSMATQFEDELSEDWKVLIDKIFQSVGLKYATVRSIIDRNSPKKHSEPIVTLNP